LVGKFKFLTNQEASDGIFILLDILLSENQKYIKQNKHLMP